MRNEFRKTQLVYRVLTLHEQGKTGSGPDIGIHWDRELSKILQAMKPTHGSKLSKEKLPKGRAAHSVLVNLTEQFGIGWLASHFQLYGYMYSKEESPKVYFWQGDADAVGWYKGRYKGDDHDVERYVIVDWKVVDILQFWDKERLMLLESTYTSAWSMQDFFNFI